MLLITATILEKIAEPMHAGHQQGELLGNEGKVPGLKMSAVLSSAQVESLALVGGVSYPDTHALDCHRASLSRCYA